MSRPQWALLGPFFQQYTASLLGTCIVAILSSLVTILLPLSIGKFYALVFQLNGNRSALLDFLPHGYFDSMPHFLLFFSMLIGVSLGVNYGKKYAVAGMGEKLSFLLRNHLFIHQLRLSPQIYEEKGVGKYLLRYSGDLKSIQNYLTKGVIGFASDLFLILLFLLVLATISHLLTLIAVFAMLLMLLPVGILNQKLHDISIMRRNRKSGLLSFVSYRLQHIPTIKAFNREQPEKEKFLKRSSQVYHAGMAYHRLASCIFVLIPALLYVMIGLIMYVIHWQVAQGIDIDQAALLSAFLLIITMLPVFRRSLRIMVTWKLGLISIKKLLAVLELPIEQEGDLDDLVIEEAHIKLEAVSLSFGEKKLFENLHADWTSPGLHLVTGGTGSGKSVLAKLLLGIYRHDDGKILIDDQDIQNISAKYLRKQVTIISDDYPLLGRNVFEAISYSRKASKRKGAALLLDKIQQALPTEAHLHLDDRIGDRGKQLSKGQERILLFARALLTRKPILLLDEPFAHVEPQMRQHLIKLIQRLRRKRTIVLLMKAHEVGEMEGDSVVDLDEKFKDKLPLNGRKRIVS